MEPDGAIQASVSAGVWDGFPLVLCVTLREREERYRQAQAEFERVGLRRVTFYRADRAPRGNDGCFNSHVACLRYLVDHPAPYALVFEDDVQFVDGWEEHVRRVSEFIGRREDWTLFYLGGFVFRRKQYLDEHIVRGASLCTHAYLIRSDFARDLLQRLPGFQGISVDLFYAAVNGNRSLIHTYPLICTQRAAESDTNWDFRGVAKQGWLSQAMVYTALRYRDRFRHRAIPAAERFRIENGIWFFTVFRAFLWLRLSLARAGAPEARFAQNGEFIPPL